MNWRLVKNFGKIKYFNISYIVLLIVPLVANIFELIGQNFSYNITIPITVKSLYFASIIYALAIAIYQYKCPSLIKEYENPQEYIDKQLKQVENKAPDLKLYIVLAHLGPLQDAIKNEILVLYSKLKQVSSHDERIKMEFDLNQKLDSVYSASVQNHLEKKYTTESKNNLIWCWLSAILYLIGSLIVFILLIIRTILVFKN